MAEIKNTFIKSKMNKDLDDRIVPNGEYRDALNVAISRSEGDDVGALENILGNSLIFENETYSTCIGFYNDKQNEKAYYFLTNYIDSSASGLSNRAPETAYCAIVLYDKLKFQNTILVEGSFLNFSARSPITGVNILEDLLFWTDNRNQPRKININTATALPAFPPSATRAPVVPTTSPYYTKEDHISVAKYYPWKPISLTDIGQQIIGDPITESTMTNPTEQYFPNGGYGVVETGVTAGTTFTLQKINGENGTGFYPVKDDYFYSVSQLVNYTLTFSGNTYTVVSATVLGGGNIQIVLDGNITVAQGNQVFFQKKPDYDPVWAGDPDFLKDKFIRLSYRFKFDDNEYSLMAPFTQPCFIPKQYGYFLTGDQEDAYRSTVVNFFENNVTQIITAIEFETLNPKVDLKIKEVDILYKESDGLQVKVIDSVDIEEVMDNMASNRNPYIYEYKYISTKPYKGLPEDQITRVFDKVPVKSLAQEIVGNRIVYGNFTTVQTPPETIDYYTSYDNKLPITVGDQYTSQIEYPNHTVKQNRNYQVGFVLADRYGRQSGVILSSNDETTELGGDYYGGSTVYVPYKPNSGVSALFWPGYSLRALVNSPIPDKSQSNKNNYIGLYNDGDGSVDYITLQNGGTGYSTTQKGVYDTTGGSGSGLRVSATGSGGILDSVSIYQNGTGYNDGDILTIVGGNNDATIRVFVSEANPLGWYSYKIVVRQTEQDYYNAYLPGILNGYPRDYVLSDGTTGTNDSWQFERDKTSNIVLLNDNINKIPRDLSEVGPDQKQYRSSVRLFGRVAPINNNSINFNQQYYPTIQGDTVVSISTLADTNYNGTTLGDITEADPNNTNVSVSTYSLEYLEFYQSNTNPLIARVGTTNKIGKYNVDPANYTYENTLAVYETDPTESLLDIYWETTSAGLISDLNIAIQDGGFLGAIQTNGYSWVCSEGDANGSDCFTDKVTVINGFGNTIYNDIVFELDRVTTASGAVVTSSFTIDQRGGGTIANPNGFNILKYGNFYCGEELNNTIFTFLIKCIYTEPVSGTVYETFVEIADQELRNEYPTIHTSSNPLSPLYVQGGAENLNEAESYAIPTLILTVYGQNGAYATTGAVTNELVWELTDDMNGRFYIETDGDKCELWLSPLPEPTVVAFPVQIKLTDKNGFGLSSLDNPGAAQLNLEYILEDGEFATVSAGNGTATCVPINEYPANPWNPSLRTGRVRYKFILEDLQPGITYSNIQLNITASQGATVDFDLQQCSIPSSYTNTDPVAADEDYYFDVIWLQSTGQINFHISIDVPNNIPVAGTIQAGVDFLILTPPPLGQTFDVCTLNCAP